MQKDGIHDAEYGGVGADAERQCEDGDSGEARTLVQHPKGITQILEQSFQPAPAPLIARRFVNQCRIPQFLSRGLLRATRVFPALDVLLRSHFHMSVEFLFQFFSLPPPEKAHDHSSEPAKAKAAG